MRCILPEMTPFMLLSLLKKQLLLSLLIAHVVAGNTCPEPISVPITDVDISDDGTSRGLAILIGSPEQTLAAMPSW